MRSLRALGRVLCSSSVKLRRTEEELRLKVRRDRISHIQTTAQQMAKAALKSDMKALWKLQKTLRPYKPSPLAPIVGDNGPVTSQAETAQ
eukprot:40591-Alexandrium_andersonii.AAC.1